MCCGRVPLESKWIGKKETNSKENGSVTIQSERGQQTSLGAKKVTLNAAPVPQSGLYIAGRPIFPSTSIACVSALVLVGFLVCWGSDRL
jgi:hypothetical protein